VPDQSRDRKGATEVQSCGESEDADSASLGYPALAICIDNRGNEASFLKGKVYQIVEPCPGDGPRDVRVIDEEREDYLYSADQFVMIELPPAKAKIVQTAVA
jgi:hypothetical protein